MNEIEQAMQEVGDPNRPKTYLIDTHLLKMSEPARAKALELLKDPVGYPHAYVAQVLTAAGYPVGRTAVGEYRRNVMGVKD